MSILISCSSSFSSSGWIVLNALEKLKKIDSHSATSAMQLLVSLLQQVDVGIVHSPNDVGKQTA